jgi:hypothetical protein
MLTGVAVEAKPFASYRWNFGNGEEVLKRALLYRYVRPGTYVVSVSVSTGGVTASDRIVVTVIPTDVSIVYVGVDGIELRNGASKDLDLTDWQLRVGSILFTFPKDTVLMAGKSLFFESRITKLDTTQKSTVDVLFPTGEVAVSTQEHLVHEPLEVVTQKEKPPPRKEVVSKKSSPPQKKVSQVSKKNNVVETAVVKELSSSGPGVVASSATSGPQVASVSNVSSGGLGAGYAIVALVALLGLSSSVIFLMKA